MVHGEWLKWLESVRLDDSLARKFIRAYNQFKDRETFPDLGIGKIFQIISLPESIDRQEFINQQYTIPSTGEQKTVDEM